MNVSSPPARLMAARRRRVGPHGVLPKSREGICGLHRGSTSGLEPESLLLLVSQPSLPRCAIFLLYFSVTSWTSCLHPSAGSFGSVG